MQQVQPTKRASYTEKQIISSSRKKADIKYTASWVKEIRFDLSKNNSLFFKFKKFLKYYQMEKCMASH